MDFAYGESFTESSPEAYERLILDVLLGDPPLFPRHEEVELSWQILDPIEKYWASSGSRSSTRPGTWGPASRGRDDGPRRPHLAAPVIIDLPDTTAGARRRQGARRGLARAAAAVALGRVLTLVIVTDDETGRGRDRAANDASASTPAGSSWSSAAPGAAAARLDAQIRVGGDAGASEVVVLRLYGRARRPRRSGRRPAAAARRAGRGLVAGDAAGPSRPRTRSARWPSADHGRRRRRATDAALERSAPLATAGRHRPRLDRITLWRGAARGRARPAAARAGDGGDGRG